MTNLELAICEAENNGEIDLYTRNALLVVLSESFDDKVDRSVESERKCIAKRMQNDLFMYLKKYVSEKEFKDKYKDFLYLINIKKDDLSYFNTSVEITE